MPDEKMPGGKTERTIWDRFFLERLTIFAAHSIWQPRAQSWFRSPILKSRNCFASTPFAAGADCSRSSSRWRSLRCAVRIPFKPLVCGRAALTGILSSGRAVLA